MIIKLLITTYFLTVSLLIFFISLPVLLVSYFIVDQKTFTYIAERFGVIILKFMTIPNIWSIKITDLRKNKEFSGQYVFIANHVSFIDTLLMWQLPVYKKFMMAEKFTKIPIFGTLCKVSGHVFVDRFNPETTVDAVDKAYKTIQDGSSFVIFPEGRRSENSNELLPFKTGAFRLANKANIPIIPICIKGSVDALPIGGLIDTAEMEMVIGNPIVISSDYHSSIEESRIFILNHLKIDGTVR